MINLFRRANAAFDRFLFASCDPVMCSVLRIAIGFLACVYAIGWLPDSVLWFSDEGVLQARTSEILHNGQYKSLYHLMPQDPIFAQAAVLLAADAKCSPATWCCGSFPSRLYIRFADIAAASQRSDRRWSG